MLNQRLRPALRRELEYIVANHRPDPDEPPCEFHPDAVDTAMRDGELIIAALIDTFSASLERREKSCGGVVMNAA